MVHWFVTLCSTKSNRKYQLWCNVGVPYPKPGLAENTSNVEFEMCTFVIGVCLWYIDFVTASTTKINRKYRLWYNVSVPYPKPGFAENADNVEL